MKVPVVMPDGRTLLAEDEGPQNPNCLPQRARTNHWRKSFLKKIKAVDFLPQEQMFVREFENADDGFALFDPINNLEYKP